MSQATRATRSAATADQVLRALCPNPDVTRAIFAGKLRGGFPLVQRR